MASEISPPSFVSALLTASIKTTVLSSLLLSYSWALPGDQLALFSLLWAKQAQLSSLHSSPLTAPANPFCTSQNQQQQGSTTFIGRVPGSPYVVIIPVYQSNTLAIVRRCIPDALQTDSRLGPYVQAGVFPRRSQAENLARYLQTLDLDARVIYRR